MVKKGTASWLAPLIALVVALVASPVVLAWLNVSPFAVELLIILELMGLLPLIIILLAVQKTNWDTIEFVLAYDIWLNMKFHAIEKKEVRSEKNIDDLAMISRAMLLRMIDKKKAVVDPDAPIKVLVRNN